MSTQDLPSSRLPFDPGLMATFVAPEVWNQHAQAVRRSRGKRLKVLGALARMLESEFGADPAPNTFDAVEFSSPTLTMRDKRKLTEFFRTAEEMPPRKLLTRVRKPLQRLLKENPDNSWLRTLYDCLDELAFIEKPGKLERGPTAASVPVFVLTVHFVRSQLRAICAIDSMYKEKANWLRRRRKLFAEMAGSIEAPPDLSEHHTEYSVW